MKTRHAQLLLGHLQAGLSLPPAELTRQGTAPLKAEGMWEAACQQPAGWKIEASARGTDPSVVEYRADPE